MKLKLRDSLVSDNANKFYGRETNNEKSLCGPQRFLHVLISICTHQVGVKALIMAEEFKTQKYYDMLHTICPELDTSQPGHLDSSKLVYRGQDWKFIPSMFVLTIDENNTEQRLLTFLFAADFPSWNL